MKKDVCKSRRKLKDSSTNLCMDDEEEELMGANQIIDGDIKETSDLYMGDQEEELIIFDRWYMSMLSTFDTFDKKIYITTTSN